MNVQETSEIRELTATELDEVSGGELMDLAKKGAGLAWRGLVFLWENSLGKPSGPAEAQVIDISQVL